MQIAAVDQGVFLELVLEFEGPQRLDIIQGIAGIVCDVLALLSLLGGGSLDALADDEEVLVCILVVMLRYTLQLALCGRLVVLVQGQLILVQKRLNLFTLRNLNKRSPEERIQWQLFIKLLRLSVLQIDHGLPEMTLNTGSIIRHRRTTLYLLRAPQHLLLALQISLRVIPVILVEFARIILIRLDKLSSANLPVSIVQIKV